MIGDDGGSVFADSDDSDGQELEEIDALDSDVQELEEIDDEESHADDEDDVINKAATSEVAIWRICFNF